MEASSKRPKRATTALSSARIFNTDSPITKKDTDIQSLLSICLLNWSHYTEEEKISIISTIPYPYRSITYDIEGRISCPISPSFVSDDKVVRDQIAMFKRDVGDGFYTKTWQEKAQKAVEERTAGKFDEYLRKHAEEMFADAEDTEDNVEAGQLSSDGEFDTRSKERKKRGKERKRGAKHVSRALATMQDVEQAEF